MLENKNRGITLIALVVTVIVLLILAGVSVSMLSGQNGILNRAGEAKEKTEDAEDLEYLRTKAYEVLVDYYNMTEDTTSEVDYVLKRLNDLGISSNENTGTIIYNGKKYDISEIIGQTIEQKAIEAQTEVKIKQITPINATSNDTTLFEKGKIRMIIQEEADSTNRAVIPNGFYYVTGAPSTGLVISDKLGDDDNNREGGNQFVWIPCFGNNSVTYGKKDDETSDKKYGLAEIWTKYKENSYCYNQFNDWTDYGGDYNSVKNYGGFYVARYEAGVPKTAPFYANENDAAYVTDEKNTTDYKPVSQKNNQVWNCISQKVAVELGKKMYDGNTTVKSQLIDSYAWDTIVNWMAMEVTDIGNSSTGYGNYNKSGFKAINTIYATHQYNNGWIAANVYKKGDITTNSTEIATGATSADDNVKNKLKNIYDMAGNMWEWTTEVGNHNSAEEMLTEEQANNAKYSVFRGGGFNVLGSSFPISYRYSSSAENDGANVSIGFRVVLYIR